MLSLQLGVWHLKNMSVSVPSYKEKNMYFSKTFGSYCLHIFWTVVWLIYTKHPGHWMSSYFSYIFCFRWVPMSWRQKEWPHSSLIGWLTEDKQIEHLVSSFGLISQFENLCWVSLTARFTYSNTSSKSPQTIFY